METPELIIGVDGGQSSTLTILATTQGEILGAAITGPADHIHEPGGLERQYKSLHEGYLGAFAAAGIDPVIVRSAYLGISGTGNLEVVNRAVPAQSLKLSGDIITALAGAIPEFVGGIVIGGTGSAAFGVNQQGESARLGGWGYFFGDEGSGYDIAHRAFQAIYQGADGRKPRTGLTDRFLAHFNCQDLAALHQKYYSGLINRDELASASVQVCQAAGEGDAIAVDILKEAGEQLGLLASGLLKALHVTDCCFSIAGVGGVFKAGDLILKPMQAKIWETNPNACLVRPRFNPAVGALLLGLKECGLEANQDVLKNIEKTLHRIRVKN